MNILLSSLLVVAVAAAYNHKQSEEYNNFRTACKEEVGATDDDLKEAEIDEECQSEIIKKWSACLFTAYKVMEGNKYIRAGGESLARMALEAEVEGDDEKYKIAAEIADCCDDKLRDVDTTREEMAKLIFYCFAEEKRRFTGA